MLVQETQGKFIHSYSDAGYTILQTSSGVEYADAMDLKEYPQEYTETDHKIDSGGDEGEPTGEPTDATDAPTDATD